MLINIFFFLLHTQIFTFLAEMILISKEAASLRLTSK